MQKQTLKVNYYELNLQDEHHEQLEIDEQVETPVEQVEVDEHELFDAEAVDEVDLVLDEAELDLRTDEQDEIEE